MRVQRPIAYVAALAGLLVLTSCAGQSPEPPAEGSPSTDPCAPLTELTPVTLGINPGVQDLVIQAVKAQGFDTKYNIDLDVRSFDSPPASAQAVTQKAVDVGFIGVTDAAQARSQGVDVFMFGALASPSNGVFVRDDSSIEDIGDLRGARFGSFTTSASAAFVILSAVASEAHGMGKLEDELGSFISAPDAALVGLLGQGELDAVLLGSTATVVTYVDGEFPQIADLSAEYLDATGITPVHVALASTDSYAEGHCGELIAFSNAIKDGVEHVRSDEQAWIEYAERLELEDPRAPEALQTLLGGNFRTDWDQSQVDGISEMLESFIPILGSEVFISEIPEGLFRLDFVAAG